MIVDLTPPEREFADSPEGIAHIAAAKRDHNYREAHKGLRAIPWSDTLERAAIRQGTSDKARRAISDQIAAKAEAARHGEVAALKALRNEARERQRKERFGA